MSKSLHYCILNLNIQFSFIIKIVLSRVIGGTDRHIGNA